jgi:uncharacterized protein YjgD (DUF1641 family)
MAEPSRLKFKQDAVRQDIPDLGELFSDKVINTVETLLSNLPEQEIAPLTSVLTEDLGLTAEQATSSLFVMSCQFVNQLEETEPPSEEALLSYLKEHFQAHRQKRERLTTLNDKLGYEHTTGLLDALTQNGISVDEANTMLSQAMNILVYTHESESLQALTGDKLRQELASTAYSINPDFDLGLAKWGTPTADIIEELRGSLSKQNLGDIYTMLANAKVEKPEQALNGLLNLLIVNTDERDTLPRGDDLVKTVQEKTLEYLNPLPATLRGDKSDVHILWHEDEIAPLVQQSLDTIRESLTADDMGRLASLAAILYPNGSDALEQVLHSLAEITTRNGTDLKNREQNIKQLTTLLFSNDSVQQIPGVGDTPILPSTRNETGIKAPTGDQNPLDTKIQSAKERIVEAIKAEGQHRLRTIAGSLFDNPRQGLDIATDVLARKIAIGEIEEPETNEAIIGKLHERMLAIHVPGEGIAQGAGRST